MTTSSRLALRDLAGEVAGVLMSPAVALVSRARRARMFHPRGHTYRAQVVADRELPVELAPLAERLAGPAIARFSAALWKSGFEHVEVLGLALRFRDSDVVTEAPSPGDQDLLFATITSPFTMPLSPFTTNAHDYLANRYWAVSPFELTGLSRLRVKFRLRPVTPPTPQELPRDERLEAQVANGGVSFALEVRQTMRLGWRPLAKIEITAPAGLDEEALRFSAFRDGRGISPRGFVQRMRHAVYPASQAARPSTSAG